MRVDDNAKALHERHVYGKLMMKIRNVQCRPTEKSAGTVALLIHGRGPGAI